MRTTTQILSRFRGLFAPETLTALVLAGAALSVSSLPALGQSSTTIAEGSRVRITASSLNLTRAVGTILEATAEGFVVQFESPRLLGTVEHDQIEALDVSTGGERHVLRALGIGFLIGAGGGAVAGFASGDSGGGFMVFTPMEAAAMGAVGLGLAGAVVGLAVGIAKKHDVWSPGVSPLPAKVVLAPMLGADGPALHVGLSIQLN